MKLKKTKILAHITKDHAVIHFLPTAVRDMLGVTTIISEIEDVAYNYKISILVINLGRVKHLTSAFLSKLVTLQRSLREVGISLRLCCMSPDLENAFRICRLDKLIPVYEDEDEAILGQR